MGLGDFDMISNDFESVLNVLFDFEMILNGYEMVLSGFG